LTRPIRHYAAARGSYSRELVAASGDVVESFRRHRLWSALALNDIAGRYRGSVLGPFWITLTTAAFVIGIGVVYADLMHVPPEKYVPWMATGIVIWNMCVQMITEGANAYIEGTPIIQATSIPLPVFIWRVILRGLINFAHQLPVVLGVAIFFHYFLTINLPMFVVGLLLLVLNTTWMAFFAAMISARFRDMQQVIATVLQLLFFLSPVIWIPSEMSKVSKVLQLNPFYHLLDVTRSPLMGHPVSLYSLGYLVIMAVAGWIVTFGLFAVVRRRIVHYL
jgi:ABC-type polysaccharide/polyol phosphate export permease